MDGVAHAACATKSAGEVFALTALKLGLKLLPNG